jgi:hypothetical protein
MYGCIKLNDITTQKILVTNDDKIIGINLGFDFINEHEMGIEKIRNYFKINNFNLGINGYSINERLLTNKLIYKKLTINKINYVALILDTQNILGIETINEEYLIKNELYPYEEIFEEQEDILYPGLYTAWSESSFGILAEEKYESYTSDLYKAFLNGDISFDIHSNKLFPNDGLTICINSRIPQDIKYDIYKKDLSYFKLLCKMEDLNIINILNKKQKEYIKLIPKWKDETEKEIIFYLVPKNQNKYKTGWFSFNELMEWTQEIGCVVS